MSVWIVAIALLLETAALAVGLGAIVLDQLPEPLKDLAASPSTKTALACVIIGGLGGCTYCLRGVYLNACLQKTWDTAWLPWYFVRPFISMITGGISYLFVKGGLLLLNASQEPDANQLGVWAIAFLAGLNVDKFVAKVESIGQSVLGLEPSRQSQPANKTTTSESS